MRKLLDALYLASGALAALFLVAIGVTVLLQVGANAIGSIAHWVTGRPLGLVVPSYAEFTGFFLAASSFLALAYTLRHGAHIRVELVIQGLSSTARRWVEVWCHAVGTVASGYFAWYAILFALESLEFGDVSPGMIAVPLWIPQAAVALGLVVLTVAMADGLVTALRGGETAGAGAGMLATGAPADAESKSGGRP